MCLISINCAYYLLHNPNRCRLVKITTDLSNLKRWFIATINLLNAPSLNVCQQITRARSWLFFAVEWEQRSFTRSVRTFLWEGTSLGKNKVPYNILDLATKPFNASKPKGNQSHICSTRKGVLHPEEEEEQDKALEDLIETVGNIYAWVLIMFNRLLPDYWSIQNLWSDKPTKTTTTIKWNNILSTVDIGTDRQADRRRKR